MAKLFDENGNEVEALTLEEVKAANEKALADYKKTEEDKKKADDDAVAAAKAAEDAARAAAQDPNAELGSRLTKIEQENRQLKIERLADKFAGNDPEKRAAFVQKFDRLTGYEESDAGLVERATDASKLAFGENPTIDIGAVAGTGGGRSIGDKEYTPTEGDKAVQEALNISAEDIAKYGKKD